MDQLKNFCREHKWVMIIGSIPLIIIVTLVLVFQAAEKQDIAATQNLNTSMTDAKVDSLALSKEQAYNKQEQDLKLAEEDPYNTGVSVDFSLLPEKKESNQTEISPEMQARLDELNTPTEQVVPAEKKQKSVISKRAKVTDEQALQAYNSTYNSNVNNKVPEKTIIEENQNEEQVRKKRGFNSISLNKNEAGSSKQGSGSVNATVFRAVQATPGVTIVFRTSEKTSINGITIPANTIISGTAEPGTGGRLSVVIRGGKGQLAAINFAVFDQDGMEGIRTGISTIAEKGATYRDQANALANEAEARLGLTGSVGRMIAGNRGGAEKQVMIPDGYKVILKLNQ